MRWMLAVMLMLGGTGCGRSDGPTPGCDTLGSRTLLHTSFEGGDDSVALLGSFYLYNATDARSGAIVARLDASSDGNLRSTRPVHPSGARVGLGFWLKNSRGSGTLTSRLSIDGGTTWTASSSPAPALSADRGRWVYVEAAFPVSPRPSGILVDVAVEGYGGGGLTIDDLRVVDYDRCLDEVPATDDEPMVFIPETPTMAAFWIDKYEATVDLDNGLGNRDQSGGRDGSTTAVALVREGVLPRNALSWYQAIYACQNAGKRLCTNLEFERACAGDLGFDYPYGDTYVDGNCSEQQREPTGSFPRCVSPFGVYDLVGNLEEWANVVTDADNAQAVGGSWNNPGRCNVILNRVGTSYAGYAGFRCCRD